MGRDLFVILHSIFKKMRKLADRELSIFGITSTEMRILNMIYFFDADGCSQDDFVLKIELDRSNVGRSLKKLEHLGYIRREKNQEDKRAFQIFLTEKGWAIKDDLMNIRENMKKTFSINIMKKEMAQLETLLDIADYNLTEENFDLMRMGK